MSATRPDQDFPARRPLTVRRIRLFFWRSTLSSAAGTAWRLVPALDKQGPKDDLLRPIRRPTESQGECTMPIYEYKCDKCGKISEILQKHFDVDEAPCEACGAPAHRIMSNTSFVLKGSGWYVTDYKSNGGCSAAGGDCNGKSSHAPAKSEEATSSASAASPCAASTTDTAACASKASSGGCASCASAASSSAAS